MSYLRFRQLNLTLRSNTPGALFKWPVIVVPVRYWSVTQSALDPLEQAILGLAQANIRDPNTIRRHLGIPETMDAMISRSVLQLRAKGFVTAELLVTGEGRTALKDEETAAREFLQGWLIFDRVRGGLFPFVRAGRFSFFASAQIERLDPVTVPSRANLPCERDLLAQGSLAIMLHNKQRLLLEDHEDEDYVKADADADLINRYELNEAIEDIELLPLEYCEEHFLLVEVLVETLAGRRRVDLRSFSPFSFWEQDSYLRILRGLDDDAVKLRLGQLQSNAQADLLGLTQANPTASDSWSAVEQGVRRALGDRARLPNELIESLFACEFNHQLLLDSDVDSPARFGRVPLMAGWASLVESSLKVIALEVQPWKVPLNWRNATKKIDKNKATKWYEDQIQSAGRSKSWIQLPAVLKNNLGNKVQNLPETFGDISSSSSRDQLARLILAILSVSPLDLSPRLNNVSNLLDAGSAPLLQQMDDFFNWRNDVAHGGDKINLLSDQEFFDLAIKTHKNIYEFLKIVFAA